MKEYSKPAIYVLTINTEAFMELPNSVSNQYSDQEAMAKQATEGNSEETTEPGNPFSWEE